MLIVVLQEVVELSGAIKTPGAMREAFSFTSFDSGELKSVRLRLSRNVNHPIKANLENYRCLSYSFS